MKKIGRPSEYTPELANEFCFRLSQGISLRTICLADDMPSGATIFNWLATNKEFLEQYTQAKEASADADAENLEILGDEAIKLAQSVAIGASSAVVNAYKLKADNMKWAMSKKKPKKYGEKVDVTSDGKAIKGNSIILSNFKDES